MSASPGPIPFQSDWAYGPVSSRRLGRSLGVNLLPRDRRVCDFDCVYCQYAAGDPAGEGLPSSDEVVAAVEAALRRDAGCDSITLAGNGEPTLHPRFAEVVERVAALRDALAPSAQVCLLTNGARLDRPGVREALRWIDRPLVKLDAGSEGVLSALNRPRARGLAALLEVLAAVPRLELQSMFVRGRVDNATPEEVQGWLQAVAPLRPRGVQVTTLDRGTQLPGLAPVSAARLEEIAAAVRALGIPAEAFPCREPGRFGEPDAA